MAHLWLRTEYKQGEMRTPLAPQHAQLLIRKGHRVTVEHTPHRIFPVSDYQKVGCEIVPSGAWEKAPQNAYILGLKNLPDNFKPLKHQHVYFAHAFKQQSHANQLLQRFVQGGGKLLDLEYLVNAQGRVVAFGFYAGIAGAAISVILWCLKMLGEKSPYKITYPYFSYQDLIADTADLLNRVGKKPSVLVIGARGRCGRGATHFLNDIAVNPGLWSRKETTCFKFGTNHELFAYDIMLNCIYVDDTTSPFLTNRDLKFNRALSVIGDISCEPGHKFNPLPIYTDTTSFDNPSIKIGNGEQSFDLISIDNLPTLLPKESSLSFSEQLIEHLFNLLNDGVHDVIWQGAEEKFIQIVNEYFPAGLRKII